MRMLSNEILSWSALPGILYYSEHAYTIEDEVDVGILKRKFDGILGGSFDDFVFASKLDDLQPEHQLIDDKAWVGFAGNLFCFCFTFFHSFLSLRFESLDGLRPI